MIFVEMHSAPPSHPAPRFFSPLTENQPLITPPLLVPLPLTYTTSSSFIAIYSQVLMAAQEPLSHSTLQQMGVSSHLTSLPGWGCLFFEADHHVYMLHKSLRCGGRMQYVLLIVGALIDDPSGNGGFATFAYMPCLSIPFICIA